MATIAPATLTAPGGVAQVSFPITEVDDKEIEHSGGLRFTPVDGGSLKITEFEVDLEERRPQRRRDQPQRQGAG